MQMGIVVGGRISNPSRDSQKYSDGGKNFLRPPVAWSKPSLLTNGVEERGCNFLTLPIPRPRLFHSSLHSLDGVLPVVTKCSFTKYLEDPVPPTSHRNSSKKATKSSTPHSCSPFPRASSNSVGPKLINPIDYSFHFCEFGLIRNFFCPFLCGKN